MSLDIQKIETLMFLGSKADNSLDEIAMDYVNKIPTSHSQTYLKTEYKNIYYASKKESKQQYEQAKNELLKYNIKI